jgi:hypothetical protein
MITFSESTTFESFLNHSVRWICDPAAGNGKAAPRTNDCSCNGRQSSRHSPTTSSMGLTMASRLPFVPDVAVMKLCACVLHEGPPGVIQTEF